MASISGREICGRERNKGERMVTGAAEYHVTTSHPMSCGCHVICRPLKVVQVHKRDVKYDSVPNGCQGLESAVNLGIYPPYIHWVIQYDSPPDRSRGTKLVNLNIDGTKEGLSFPFTVYRVKGR